MRVQGRGTFVKQEKPGKIPILDHKFTESMKKGAPNLVRRILRNEFEFPPVQILEKLGLDEGEECFCACRLDVLGEDRIAVDKLYFLNDYAHDMDKELLSRVDFGEIWVENNSEHLSYCVEEVEAVALDEEIANILAVKPGSVGLKTTDLYSNVQRQIIAIIETYYRADRIMMLSTHHYKG